MPEETQNKEPQEEAQTKPEQQPNKNEVTTEELDTRLKAVEEVLKKEQKL